MNAAKPTRSLWPYAIIGFFALAIIYLVVFIGWTMRQREDLVAENYYESEIRYQEQIERLKHALPFEGAPVVTYDVTKQSIVIALPNAQSGAATGRVHLYRPSDARLDRELPLAVDQQGMQTLDARRLLSGLWKVRVHWTIAGKDYYCDRSVIVPG